MSTSLSDVLQQLGISPSPHLTQIPIEPSKTYSRTPEQRYKKLLDDYIEHIKTLPKRIPRAQRDKLYPTILAIVAYQETIRSSSLNSLSARQYSKPAQSRGKQLFQLMHENDRDHTVLMMVSFATPTSEIALDDLRAKRDASEAALHALCADIPLPELMEEPMPEPYPGATEDRAKAANIMGDRLREASFLYSDDFHSLTASLRL